MPRASIIIPTFNRPHLLPRAVESAQAAGNDVEIIVVDDASVDETAAVCASLTGIKYIRLDRNQRVAGARNAGLLASSGEYVTFLDDDDLRLADTLDEQVELLRSNPDAALVYGQAIIRDKSTEQVYPLDCPKGDVFWQLLTQNFIPCGSAVFRRSFVDQIGLLDSDLPGIDDWDLWIRIAELHLIIALAKPVMIWRRSNPVSAQGTSRGAEIVSRAVQQFKSSWIKLPRAVAAPREQKQLAWSRFADNMASHLVWETMRSLSYSNVGQATRNIFGLAQVGPLPVLRLAQKTGRFLMHRTRRRQSNDLNSGRSV
ncbi:MAG TPA: glycosyltransferase family 2 protein [Pyrinomonadaceae bacterium]